MAQIQADASNSTIAFIDEATWGTTPASPALQSIRQTGNGLTPTLNKAVSDEISADAAVTDVIPTSGGAEGDINFEPSYGEWVDGTFEHALRDDFTTFGIAKGGNDYKSMFIERTIYSGATPYYFRYGGSRANSLAYTFDAEATSPITATFNVMSKSEETDTSIVSGATYVAANTNPVMSMPELRELNAEIDGVSKTACYKTLNVTINNNIRMQQGKCTDTTAFPDLTAKGAGYGRREITVDVAYYFNDLDYATMFQQNQSGSFSWIMTDGTRGYKITLPNIKILESSIPIEGNDADVVQTMTVQALYDSTEGTDIIVEKIGNIGASTAIKLTGDPITPSDLPGTYYYDGSTQENSENVYFSLNGNYAIWYDGTDTVVTPADEVGAAVTTYFNVLTSTDPTGTWVAVTGTGTLTGAAYDPTA